MNSNQAPFKGSVNVMNNWKKIRPVKEILELNKINLPNSAGIYAFWWIGKKDELLSSQRIFVLSGPNQSDISVTMNDWWPPELPYPCLYVGKSTNLKNRFSLHIKNGSPGKLHKTNLDGFKIRSITTSCQLRYGIEHLFPNSVSPLNIIHNKVGFSYRTDFQGQPVVERFFEEDRLIGTWRPWFNVDSER